LDQVTKNKDIVKQAGLKAVPVSLIFKSGLLVGEINGLLSKKSLRGKFDSMIAAYSGMDTADIAARQLIRSRNGASASGQGDLRDAVCTFKPKLFFPGRTFYPSRWNSDFTGEAEGKRRGLVRMSIYIYCPPLKSTSCPCPRKSLRPFETFSVARRCKKEGASRHALLTSLAFILRNDD
jgi:hypothetical protein